MQKRPIPPRDTPSNLIRLLEFYKRSKPKITVLPIDAVSPKLTNENSLCYYSLGRVIPPHNVRQICYLHNII